MNTVFYKEENNHYCYVGYLLEELNTHGWKMVNVWFCLRRSCWIVDIFRLMKNEVFWLDSLSYCQFRLGDISARKVLRPQDFFQPLFDVKEINIETKTLITRDIDVLMCFISNHN